MVTLASHQCRGQLSPIGAIKDEVRWRLSGLKNQVKKTVQQLPGTATGVTQAPESYCGQALLSLYTSGWPYNLDWGIYWFGSGNRFSKATDGSRSEFYDPTKKTVLFFHGWTGAAGGWTQICKRATTRCFSDVCRGTEGGLFAEAWLRDGWNVGLFYWDQFADEECTRDAEQKIWFDRGGNGFGWKSFNVTTGVSTYVNYKEDMSIADMCVRAVKMTMGDFKGPTVRFVGHSIGSQLAVRCAAKLHHEGHVASPVRLTMLEPFFTKHHLYFFRCNKVTQESGVGQFTALATAQYVKSLWQKFKVPTEVYKSSLLTENGAFGVPDKALEDIVALVEYNPTWCGGTSLLARTRLANVECQHNSMYPTYFLSYEAPIPQVSVQFPLSNVSATSALRQCIVPAAKCTDGQIAEWVERQLVLRGNQKWTQIGGTNTFNLSDDVFQMTPSPLEATRIIGRKPITLQSRRSQNPLDMVLGKTGFVFLLAFLVLFNIVLCIVISSSMVRRCSGSGDTETDEEDSYMESRELMMSKPRKK